MTMGESTTHTDIPISVAMNNTMKYEEIYLRYKNAGQEHVFDYYETIPTDQEKQDFLQQLNDIPVEGLPSLLAMAQQSSSSSDSNATILPFTGNIGRSTNSTEDTTQWYNTGIQAIAQGQVAALVLAGGQGTRLGYAGPKGMYQIGLPSQKSLFQLISERIYKLNQLAAAAATATSTTHTANNTTNNTTHTTSTTTNSSTTNQIPFYIMTSPLNHNETVSYFASNNYFNLGSDNVFFFQQGMLPCLTTTDGKMILESRGTVAMAPDGNGGIYPSLQSSGALRHMQDRNIQYLHVFSIDNALVKPADPIFIGYCIANQADCGNKVVWKSHPHEAVGVMAVRNDKPCIVEYSEITKEMAEQVAITAGATTPQLVYGAGNICNHFYTLSFITDTILPNMGNLYHMAHKKIPYYDGTTQTTITPPSNNGIKLETFIFDVFPLSERMCIFDVIRKEEFAPVKNAPGASSDTPESACTMISELAQSWVVQAGGTLLSPKDDVMTICEISPLVSYAGEGLEVLVQGKEITCPFQL
jgi:UDP-N-acetylglucosamine/UDP-N-acetylgalactosamine diphosphorylase